MSSLLNPLLFPNSNTFRVSLSLISTRKLTIWHHKVAEQDSVKAVTIFSILKTVSFVVFIMHGKQ